MVAEAVRLGFGYPDARLGLNRLLPLVRWFLAIPHYIVLAFVDLGVLVVVTVAWFAILFTGRDPRGLFGSFEGVIRWHNHVVGLRLRPGYRRVPALPVPALDSGFAGAIRRAAQTVAVCLPIVERARSGRVGAAPPCCGG